MKEGKKDIKKEGSFPFIALLLLDLLTHWPKDYSVLNICPQNEMEIKMLGTGCTLAGEWVAVLWFLLSSWAFLPGNLRSHDRHRWIFQKGHFWQSVVNFLTYGTCLIFFFFPQFADDDSLVYFGFSLIRVSRTAREDCGESFEWQHLSTFSEHWRILLLGLLEDGLFSWQVVWPPQGSLGFLLGRSKVHSWMLS